MMKKGLLIFLGLIVLVGGGFVVYTLTRDVEAVDNKLPTATPAPDSQIYGIDLDASELSFVIETNIADISASFKMADGTIELQPAENGWRLAANIILDGDSVDAGDPLANYALKFGLEVEKYPYGVFSAVSEEIITDIEADQTLTVTGNLELHGVTQPKTVIMNYSMDDNGRILITAETTVDMRDFDAEFPESVGNNVLDATFTLVADKALAPAPATETPADVTPEADTETTPEATSESSESAEE